MGYYSDFTIEVEPDPGDLEVVLQNASDGYQFEWINNAYRAYEIKWYSFDRDMRRLSEEYPNVEFTVTRQTEDHKDTRFSIMRGNIIRKYERAWVEVN